MSATLTLSAFLALAPQCAPGVHPETLVSVMATESRFALYAVATNANGRTASSRRLSSEADAASAVRALIAGGITSIDMGPMQINWAAGHLQRRGLPIEAAFRPCDALRVGADVLADCWRRAPVGDEQGRLNAALSCYNTGNHTRGLTNGYVQKVRASAEQFVPALRLSGDAAPAPTPRPDDQPTAAEPACVVPEWDVWARCPQPDAVETSPPEPEPEAPVILRGVAMGKAE